MQSQSVCFWYFVLLSTWVPMLPLQNHSVCQRKYIRMIVITLAWLFHGVFLYINNDIRYDHTNRGSWSVHCGTRSLNNCQTASFWKQQSLRLKNRTPVADSKESHTCTTVWVVEQIRNTLHCDFKSNADYRPGIWTVVRSLLETNRLGNRLLLFQVKPLLKLLLLLMLLLLLLPLLLLLSAINVSAW